MVLQEAYNIMIENWYKGSEEGKGFNPAEGENDDESGDEDYKYSDQPSSSPQVETKKRKFRSRFNINKRLNPVH